MIPKFRAWHKELKIIRDVYEIDWEAQCVMVWLYPESEHADLGWDVDVRGQWIFDENFELLQWTGLQDIDGKDIYLHDILSLDADNILKFKVGWDIETAAFQLQTLEGSRVSGFYFSAIGACPTRILGNIYENPELLQCST